MNPTTYRALLVLTLIAVGMLPACAWGQDDQKATAYDVEIQKQALVALAQSSDDQRVSRLAELAEQHPLVEIRKQAVFWLSQQDEQGAAEAAEALARIARGDDDLAVKKQVLFAYAQLPGGRGTAPLMAAARHHPNPAMREQAIFWLSQQGGCDVVGLFDELIKTEAGPVQKQIVFAYAQLPDGAGVPRLISLARDHPSTEVRKQAVFWLGQSDDERARDALVSLLSTAR